MKKKIYILLMFLLTIFIPFGCNEHSFQTDWTSDNTHHWHKCSDCDEIVDKEEHNFINNICSECDYEIENPNPNQPPNDNTGSENESENDSSSEIKENEKLENYFYEVQYTKIKTSFNDAYMSPTEITWQDLVNGQIDAFAQDLLYRLSYVYGTNSENTHNKTSEFFMLKNLKGYNYNYGPYNAFVFSETLLSEVDFNNKNDFFFQGDAHQSNPFDLKCIECYQTSMVDYSQDNSNYLYSSKYLNLAGAIEGRNTSLVNSQLSTEKINENAWNWWDDSLLNSNPNSYIEKYKNNFKMAVVEILSNKTPTAQFIESDYLQMIDNLFEFKISDYKEQITSFVLNTIIGNELVEKDNALYNSDYFINNNYLLTTQFSEEASTNENSPRLFKAYNILISKIVERSTLNEFRDYDGTPLDNHKNIFCKLTKVSSTQSFLNYIPTDNYIEDLFNTLTIKQKANVVPTTLVVDVKGIDTSINKNLNIDLEIVISGVKYNLTKNITLSAEAQRLEFDIKNLTGGLPLNSYNNKTDYLKFNFNNVYGYKFAITFIKMKAE